MITKDNLHLINFLQKNILNFLIMMVFFFFQMSLNFLSIFSISQPYLMVICLFLLIRNSESPPSGISLILLGTIYDLITGTHIGIHSLFFLLIKLFVAFYENNFYISKNYGEWILFAIVYSKVLVLVKLIFLLIIFKIPDLFSISFNLGCTLLFFPIIKFLYDLPKNVLRFF